MFKKRRKEFAAGSPSAESWSWPRISTGKPVGPGGESRHAFRGTEPLKSDGAEVAKAEGRGKLRRRLLWAHVVRFRQTAVDGRAPRTSSQVSRHWPFVAPGTICPASTPPAVKERLSRDDLGEIRN